MSWLKNWKTTLVGLGIGGLQMYQGGTSLKNTALAVAFAGLGVLCKDFNISGGSQPPTQ